MARRPALLALVLTLAAAAVIAVLALRAGDDERADEDGPAPTTARARSTSPVAPPEAGAAKALPSRTRPAGHPRIPKYDREARKRLATAIEAARRQRTAAPAKPPTGSDDQDGAGTLDKEYIQERVRELVPLIKECYELALDEDPALDGKLIAQFTIAGEPDVGGYVQLSEVDAEESTIANETMVECITETVYAAEFDAPPTGGHVVVRYPFVFRSNDAAE